MPTLMPSDTAAALGPNAEKCDSRSLLLDRFVDATAKEDARKSIFTRAFTKPCIRNKAISWPPFLTNGVGLKLDDLLFGKLQARLMVNMAGGVMENAGLCLDRFGIPYIPGSAVKGCARRMAIQEMLEQPTDQKAALLVNIALVFGWGDLDWSHKQKDGRFISDFAYACGAADWEEIREGAAKLLFAAFPNWKSDPKKPLWLSLPNYAGSLSFLPAYPTDLGKTGKVDGLPLDVPPFGKLELDVVTCHHREYYAGNPRFANAPDTEEPVPVVFPAVAPGHVFVFAVVPLRGCDAQLLKQARYWLKAGLETFGIGAKTNAGYGWFDCSEALQQSARAEVERQLTEDKKRQAEAQAARQAKEEAEAKVREELARVANAPPHERSKLEYLKLDDERFAAQAKKHVEMTDEQRHGFVLALKKKRETAKRWAKKKPELIKPWQDYARKLQPPIELR